MNPRVSEERIVAALHRVRIAMGSYQARKKFSRGKISTEEDGDTRVLEKENFTRRNPGMAIDSSHPDERDPQELGSLMDTLAMTRGWETSLSVGGIIGRWEQVVGTDIAAHCTPESFEDGLLVIKCSSTSWATQLRLTAPDVMDTINKAVGGKVIQTIKINGPAGHRWKKGRRSVNGRGPRDTYG